MSSLRHDGWHPRLILAVALCNASITIKDVHYIPDLCANLLSVSQIVKNNNEVIFNKNGCRIVSENGALIATGTLVNNMFKLDVKSRSKDFACLNIEKISDLELWHKRLGHASFSKMNLLLNIKSLQNDVRDIKCVTCVKGKQARKPFVSSGSRASNLLDIVHSDVCGPMDVESLGGAKYFVTFIDDFSRKVFAYFLRSKGEVFDKFIEFKNFVEKQTGKKIKVIRSDDGSEYVNKNFNEHFIANGIKHEKTVTYTPQQNGVAERMNRTIMEKVRCLLIDADMAHVFWAEALSAAIDIINT